MRKGLLGPFQLGALQALNETLRIAHRVTGKNGCDLEALFFATAFQAGIDQFLLPTLPEKDGLTSGFVSSRTIYAEPGQFDPHWEIVNAILSKYLPDNWNRNDKFSEVWAWSSFLADLLFAMQGGMSLLAVLGIPQRSKLKTLLPTEIVSPILTLVESFQNIGIPAAVPSTIVKRENIERFKTVMLSDVFSNYVTAQETLGQEEVTARSAIARVTKAGRDLVNTNPQILAIRQSAVNILSFTPKLIDATFGRLPGALAETAVKLGINFFEKRHRVVVYDFRNLLESVLISNLSRMLVTEAQTIKPPKATG
jgi:hypothetical protein